MFFRFFPVLNERAPHIKFSVADFAAEASGLCREVADYIFWLQFWPVSIKASLLVHTGFAGTRTTKIAKSGFLAGNIFLTRIAII